MAISVNMRFNPVELPAVFKVNLLKPGCQMVFGENMGSYFEARVRSGERHILNDVVKFGVDVEI